MGPASTVLLYESGLSATRTLSGTNVTAPEACSRRRIFDNERSSDPTRECTTVYELLKTSHFVLGRGFNSGKRGMFLVASRRRCTTTIEVYRRRGLEQLSTLASKRGNLSSRFKRAQRRILHKYDVLLRRCVRSDFKQSVHM